ncbi:MAG: hypothetical protein HPAVJP_3560 [Candidatus Hepatoplasma vulgare]|nr:MAG: hypothetical protein HPAVJP_3560 [Candidatus Hepatoplasma sp.]
MTNEYSYIESGIPINWYPNQKENSINFGLIIHENENHDFYENLISNDSFIKIGIGDRPNGSNNIGVADYEFPCINMPTEEELDLNSIYEYIFEINIEFFKDDQYWLYKIEDNILSIDNYYDEPLNNIRFYDDLKITNNDFKQNTFNPYIVGKNGFKIIKTTENSVQFQIKAINDYEESYDFENSSFNVTLNNIDNDFIINTKANYIGIGEEDNTYVYEINGLTSDTNYEILSLDNTNLSVLNPCYENDSSISINDTYENGGLNSDGHFKTIREEKSYIEEKGFEILDTTSNSVKFQITVIEDEENSFDPSISLNVTINDSLGNSINKTANYIEEESSGNNYVYEITGLEEGTNYEIISLNDTGLAVGSGLNEIDNEILISDDLGADGSFNTLNDDPYIEEKGFEILDTTSNSVKFQITVIEDEENSFDPSISLNVTINDSLGNSINKTANYIEEESSGNNYVYEITDLEEGTSYEIISLNDTGLAVGSGLNEIDNEILINDDLEAEGNFVTSNTNPYIETGANSGFEIINYTETTVTYTINVYNKKPNENIDVTLTLNENNLASPKINNNLTETKTYSSHLVDSDEENNKYTYKVTNLNDNTDYTFYSLDNSGLAIGSSSEEIDDQIILTDELFVNPNLLFFKTYESKIPNYVWIILIIFLIIIIFIGILLVLKIINKNKEKKIDREINNLAGERINKKVQKNKTSSRKKQISKKSVSKQKNN